MDIDVVELTSELIAMPSETPTSNRAISDFLRAGAGGGRLRPSRSWPTSTSSTWKRSAWSRKKGTGTGGLGLFSHSDTVPGDAGWEPFTPVLEDGRLGGPRLGRHEGASGRVDPLRPAASTPTDAGAAAGHRPSPRMRNERDVGGARHRQAFADLDERLAPVLHRL